MSKSLHTPYKLLRRKMAIKKILDRLPIGLAHLIASGVSK